MKQILPECLPCVIDLKNPKDQIDYIFYTRIMLELGFIPDPSNNIYTKAVDGEMAAYLTTLYSKDEVYDYVKDCVDKGFKITSGEKAPSIDDIHRYQQALMQDEQVSYRETVDNSRGIGLYLTNYMDIINERTNANVEEMSVSRRGR